MKYNIKTDWIMKDGTSIKIKDMETSHIENVIKMLKRHPYYNIFFEENVNIFNAELKLRFYNEILKETK